MTTPSVRARRVVPFVAVVLASLPLVVIGHPMGTSYRLVGVAAGLFALTGALLVAVPWFRLADPARLLVVVSFCSAVAVMRQAAGGLTGGYTVLLILPIVWLAVYGRRFEVLATVALTGLTLSLPIVFIGGPEYPVSEWRQAALTMMAFALTGLVVNRLVSRIDRHQRMLGTVLEATVAFGGPSLGRELCSAVVRAAGAEAAAYHELDGDRAQVWLADHTGRTIPVGTLVPLTDAVAHVVETGEPQPVDRLDPPEPIGPAVSSTNPVDSVLRQPVIDGGRVFGVLEVGWNRPLRQLDEEVRQVVALLSREAAAVTTRNRLISRLDELAHMDQLTGVLNRRAWDEAFGRELARLVRYGGTTTLALIDLDLFKQYNDQFGHLAGDDLLVAATTAWCDELRNADVLARWGGEEFVLLMPGTDLEEAGKALDRLRAVTPNGQSFSAGLVSVRGQDPNALIRAADDALYRAKQGGRNRNEISLVSAS